MKNILNKLSLVFTSGVTVNSVIGWILIGGSLFALFIFLFLPSVSYIENFPAHGLIPFLLALSLFWGVYLLCITSSSERINLAASAELARVHASYRSTIARLQARSKASIEDEQLLQELVESTSIGLVLIQAKDMSVVRVNAAANSLLFNTPILNVQFLHADGGAVPSETFQRYIMLSTRKSSVWSDLYIRAPDQSLRALSIAARPVFSGGKLRYVALSLVDITEFREAEKAKSDFVSLASHQLRTPVSTINWYAELLLGEGVEHLSNDQKENIIQISESCRRLSKLVTALLDTSRVELGTLRHDEGFFDPVQVATSTIAQMRPLATRKRISIHEHIDNRIPLTACGSKVGMIVFENLMTNAVKYTNEGGDIWCDLAFDENESGFIFTVADNGIGIPENEAPEIFTRFYRASNAKEVDAIGSGLGLSIVRSLVERAGGHVKFAPRQGGGTIFTIRLPFTCSK